MKKFVYLIIISLVCLVTGSGTICAGSKEANSVVVYTLSPAPTCQNCVNKIKGNLRFEKGVKAIDVNLKEKNVKITYSPAATTPETLVNALNKIGYTALPFDADKTSTSHECTGDACSEN